MHWLHITGTADSDVVVNLESVSYLNIRASEKMVSFNENGGNDVCYHLFIEALIGNCAVMLHKSPEICIRNGVESDQKKAHDYEQKCRHFFRELVSYVTKCGTPDAWETRKVIFAPDYTSDKSN